MQSNVLNDLAKAKRRRTEKKNLRTSVSSGIESWVRHQHAFGRPVRTPGTRLPLKYEGKSLLTQLLQKARHLIPEAVPWVPPDSTPLCARLIDRQNQSHIACRHFASRMFCPWVPWNAQGTNFHLNFNLQLSMFNHCLLTFHIVSLHCSPKENSAVSCALRPASYPTASVVGASVHLSVAV